MGRTVYLPIHEWLIFMVNVGKYSIHGSSGFGYHSWGPLKYPVIHSIVPTGSRKTRDGMRCFNMSKNLEKSPGVQARFWVGGSPHPKIMPHAKNTRPETKFPYIKATKIVIFFKPETYVSVSKHIKDSQVGGIYIMFFVHVNNIRILYNHTQLVYIRVFLQIW